MAKINILNPYNFRSFFLDVNVNYYVQANKCYVDFLEHWLSETEPTMLTDRGLELVRSEILRGGEIADIIIDTNENFIITLNSVEGCEHHIFIANFRSKSEHKRCILEPFTYPVRLIENPSYDGSSHKNTDLAASVVSTLIDDARANAHMPMICDITWFNALDYGLKILNVAKEMKNVMIYESGVLG